MVCPLRLFNMQHTLGSLPPQDGPCQKWRSEHVWCHSGGQDRNIEWRWLGGDILLMVEILHHLGWRLIIDPLFAVFYHIHPRWCRISANQLSLFPIFTLSSGDVDPNSLTQIHHFLHFLHPRKLTAGTWKWTPGGVHGTCTCSRMQWAGPPGLHALHGYPDQVTGSMCVNLWNTNQNLEGHQRRTFIDIYIYVDVTCWGGYIYIKQWTSRSQMFRKVSSFWGDFFFLMNFAIQKKLNSWLDPTKRSPCSM